MPACDTQEGYTQDQGKGQVMGQIDNQHARDAAMFAAWRDGETQAEIGARYGITQQAVSLAIGRHVDHLPAQDKAGEIRRSLALVDDLVQTFAGKARAGDPAASREIRGLLALRGRFLGIDRREVHVEHGGQVEHVHRGPTLDQVLDRYRAEGIIRPALQVEARRLDQVEER